MKRKFTVTGMTCAACSARVEKVTKAVPGVQQAEVNLLAGTMVAEIQDENAVQSVIQAITDAGYGAALAGEKKAEKTENKTETKVDPELSKRRELNMLKNQLDEAVKEQRYEDAIVLRDKIKELEN